MEPDASTAQETRHVGTLHGMGVRRVGAHAYQALEEHLENPVRVGDTARESDLGEIRKREDGRREGVGHLPQGEKERVGSQLVQRQRLVVAKSTSFPWEHAVQI